MAIFHTRLWPVHVTADDCDAYDDGQYYDDDMFEYDAAYGESDIDEYADDE